MSVPVLSWSLGASRSELAARSLSGPHIPTQPSTFHGRAGDHRSERSPEEWPGPTPTPNPEQCPRQRKKKNPFYLLTQTLPSPAPEPRPASRTGPTGPTLRANPCPEVTDLICRLPLPTLVYRPEASHLGDRLRIWVRTVPKIIGLRVHPDRRGGGGRFRETSARSRLRHLRPRQVPHS